MKITFLILSTFLIFNISNSSAQGCMESSSSEGVALKGFIQPQFSYKMHDADANGNNMDVNSFEFNRARIGVLGSIPYDFKYYFFIETSPFKNANNTPHLLDAFVSYSRYEKYATVTMGQFKSPISLEQNTGCSNLYTIFRSSVVDKLAGPQRDIGIMFSGGGDTTLFRYNLAYMNGSGRNVIDDNKGKDIVGRLRINPIEGLSVGGSFRFGKTTPTNPIEKENDISRFAGEFLLKKNGLMVQGEYFKGTDKLHSTSKVAEYNGCSGVTYVVKPAGSYNMSGFYTMVTYKTRWNIEPVIKFESYDPDTGTGNDISNVITGGFSVYPNDWTRLQINYIHVMEEDANNQIRNDIIALQIQTKF